MTRSKLFVSVFLITSQTILCSLIPEGYVTFATANYFELLKVTLESHKHFSKKPIVAFGINDDIPFNTDEFPLLIKKRINVDLSQEHIFFQKPKIILASGIENGIYIEADDILNKDVDELFEQCKTITTSPLCPKHPQDPNDQYYIMSQLNVHAKSMPYVHGHVVFSPSCRSFIELWFATCLEWGEIAPNKDETILNVLLWKFGATAYLPVYDPFVSFIEAYLKNDCTPFIDYFGFKIKPYMFHGCKEPQAAQIILNKLIAYHHGA